LVPVPRLGKKGLANCHTSASQVLNTPTWYLLHHLAENDALPDPNDANDALPFAISASPASP